MLVGSRWLRLQNVDCGMGSEMTACFCMSSSARLLVSYRLTLTLNFLLRLLTWKGCVAYYCGCTARVVSCPCILGISQQEEHYREAKGIEKRLV